MGWVGFEFAAQVGHVHAQVVGVFGVVGAPDFGEQLALREYAACVGGQNSTDMFGIEFMGHPDPRPLLVLEEGFGFFPLRKSYQLPGRPGQSNGR